MEMEKKIESRSMNLSVNDHVSSGLSRAKTF